MEHRHTTSTTPVAPVIPPSVLDVANPKKMPAHGETDKQAQLIHALRQWWSQETADWDLQVEASGNDFIRDANHSDLWDSLPELDSKTVARTSPIFKEHLGRPLDVKLIRPGGYESLDDMINDLVPAMMKASNA